MIYWENLKKDNGKILVKLSKFNEVDCNAKTDLNNTTEIIL